MDEKARISISQMFILLFLSRVFSLQTLYQDQLNTISSGQMTLIALMDILLCLLAVIPIFLLMKWKGQIAFPKLTHRLCGKGGNLFLLLYGILFVLIVIDVSMTFTAFAASVFEGINGFFIVTALLITVWMVMRRDLESIARTVVMFFYLFLFFISIIIIFRISTFNFQPLQMPQLAEINLSELSQTSLQNLTGHIELILLLFLIPFGDRGKKNLYGFGAYLTGIFVLTVMGSIFTISDIGKYADLYVILATLFCFTKIIILLHIAVECFHGIFPKTPVKEIRPAIMALPLILAYLLSQNPDSAETFHEAIYSGYLFYAASVVIPLLLLLAGWMQSSRHEKRPI